MCGVDEDDGLIFRDQGEDWFGDKEKEQERRIREEERLQGIKNRLEQDELDFGDIESGRDAGGEAPEAQEQEGIKARVYRVEGKPSKEEVEAHMTTHVPFRSWCAHCVKGKSKAMGHKKADHKEEEIPVVSVDYMFMESGSTETELGMPILAVKDRKSGFRA